MKTADADPRPMTVEDYRATPEGARYQLISGELVMAPAPSRYHQIIIGNLYLLLRTYLAAHSIGEAYVSPFDVYLTEHDVFQPDVVFVSTERLSILADDGARGGPDLVIEVISPSSAHADKTSKRDTYATAGVREYWLVDPHLRLIHVYDFAQNRTKAVRLVDEDETFESPLLPGLTIPPAEVFREQHREVNGLEVARASRSSTGVPPMVS
jgi:Uma2 family endonuclease